MLVKNRTPVHWSYDPWDPIHSLRKYGEHRLTSIEMTVTYLCNLRCEHCAVGDALIVKEGEKLPVSLMIERLEELPDLETISITGGEPSFDKNTVKEYILPLLKYARERGLNSQLNSNLTLDYSRYEMIAPYLDIMHISYNYTSADDFYQVGFARTGREVARIASDRLYEKMLSNIERLSSEGMYISAESMINYRTKGKIGEIHRRISELGCKRHEVHPMYPSSFASHLPVLSLDEFRGEVNELLDARDPDIWILFGTLPFFHCSDDSRDQQLLSRLKEAPRTTVRNDPDGKNRLNVDVFSGEVYVTDFSDLDSFGNFKEQRLDDIYTKWLEHPLYHEVNCHCPAAACSGPNLLVKNTYYKGVNFLNRKAHL